MWVVGDCRGSMGLLEVVRGCVGCRGLYGVIGGCMELCG